MKITAHAVWIQGEANLPAPYRANLDAWRAFGVEIRLWDHDAAAALWDDYADHAGHCSHHAMRADLILARALRDFGGLAIGTDSRPVNFLPMAAFCDQHDAWLTIEMGRNGHAQIASGLVFFKGHGHPLTHCVCRHQLRDRSLLRHRNVAMVTGPECWWTALKARAWKVVLVSSAIAFTHQWYKGVPANPEGWVDPGFAGSWAKPETIET